MKNIKKVIQVDTSLKLTKTSKSIFVHFKEIQKLQTMLIAAAEKKRKKKRKTKPCNLTKVNRAIKYMYICLILREVPRKSSIKIN